MKQHNIDNRQPFWSLTRAFAAAVVGNVSATERSLRAAFRAGLEPAKAFESFRMVHLFAGFPRNLTALEALHAALPKATKIPRARRAARVGAAGDAAFDRIYGAQARAVRAYLTDLDPAVAAWIAGHAYGTVLARPGLDLRERELFAVAALAATAQEKQLASHARGALRCGATPQDLEHALIAAKPFTPSRLALRYRELLRQTAARA